MENKQEYIKWNEKQIAEKGNEYPFMIVSPQAFEFYKENLPKEIHIMLISLYLE